jgi:hypothetical protein
VVRDGVDAFREPPLLSVRAHGVMRLVSSNASGSPVLFESTSGGRRFERVGPLGLGQYFGGAFGPGSRLLLTDDENGLATRIADRAGPSQSHAGFAIHDQAIIGNSSAAAWTGRTPVIAGAIVGRALAWHWSGRGSPADPRAWRREALGRAAHIAMASGPRGLFLLQDGANPEGPDLLRLWRWHHGRFVRDGHLPRVTSASATDAIALAQDGQGALVAAWDATPFSQVDVAVSVDGGRHWTAERTITGDVTPMFRLTLALGRGGRGILAYDSVQGRVWMARISVAGLRRPVGSTARPRQPRRSATDRGRSRPGTTWFLDPGLPSRRSPVAPIAGSTARANAVASMSWLPPKLAVAPSHTNQPTSEATAARNGGPSEAVASHASTAVRKGTG